MGKGKEFGIDQNCIDRYIECNSDIYRKRIARYLQALTVSFEIIWVIELGERVGAIYYDEFEDCVVITDCFCKSENKLAFNKAISGIKKLGKKVFFRVDVENERVIKSSLKVAKLLSVSGKTAYFEWRNKWTH